MEGDEGGTRIGSDLGTGMGTGAAAAARAGGEEAAGEALSQRGGSKGPGPAEDEEEEEEEGDEERRLAELLGGLQAGSARTRRAALQGLRRALAARSLAAFLLERRLTLADGLERSLRRGTGEENSLAGSVLALLCLQVGPGPQGEEVFRSTKPLLVSVLTNGATGLPARQSCATALGVCCYVAAADPEDLFSCLSCLEGIFSDPSADEGGSGLTQHGPLHCSALQAWSLLLTICPPSHIRSLLDSLWLKLPPLLSSNSVALRIVAGETIALVFELAQEMEEGLCHRDTEFLRAQLKVLATENSKHRAKTERRKQRSVFRDVLRFIESGEHPEETIRFGLECLYLDSWARQRTYQAFREVLGSGICHHLQNNELLREIFSLGPPVVLDAAALKASKVSRLEKHLYNSAASKARTKARSRVRDKHADVLRWRSRAASRPSGLQTQHCEGPAPQPSGFYTCTAEYLMPGAAPQGAAPSFIFLTKERIKGEPRRGASDVLLRASSVSGPADRCGPLSCQMLHVA